MTKEFESPRSIEYRRKAVEVQKGHPKGLAVLFFAEMWERFSFYGLRALLLFYMTRHFRFGDTAAYGVYGSYTSLVYATPVIGGLVADRLLGFRKSVVLGGVLMALGHFAMAFDDLQVFYFALALVICGNGFFKPNISTIVGRLYPEGDPRRDSGFTLFYMGINLGAAAASLLCGYVGETYGFHYGFSLAGFGMLLGLLVFLRGQKLLGGVAEPPKPDHLRAPWLGPLSREHTVYGASVLAVFVAWQLVQRGAVVGSMLSGVGLIVAAGLIWFLIARCEPVERDRLLVAVTLIVFSIAFWACFEQAGSSINLFTDRNVDRTVGGVEIKPSVFQSVNPAFILLFGPVFSALWIALAKRNLEPSAPMKFSFALVQLGLGFGALYAGAVTANDGVVALGWLILGYLLHTTGELCLSPVGLSMVTKLSPPRIVGVLMGTWFLSSAFAQYIASLIAMLTGVREGGATTAAPAPAETVMVYGSVFGKLAVVAIALGCFLLVLARPLARRMHGVK